MTIVSLKSYKIANMIKDDKNWGVTIYEGKNGFGKKGEMKNIDVVYSVITRLQLNRLNAEIEKIDPDAFIVISSVRNIKGE